MGLLSSIFGGGSDKKTTTTNYSKDVQALQSGLTKGVAQGIDPFLSNPSVFVADMNPYQTGVGLAAHGLVDYAYGSNSAGALGNYADSYRGMMDRGDLLDRVGVMDRYIPGYSQNAIDASTYGVDDIAGYANPNADAMNDVAQRNLRDAYGTTQSDIGARAAAGGAFGGSGEAIERAQAAKNYMKQSADTATQIRSDAYGQGAQIASNNANNLTAAYQSAGNDIYNRALGANTYGDNLRNDAFSQRLQALGGASDYDLSRVTFDNNAANDFMSRNSTALGLMGGYGDVLQAHDQAVGDRPYTQFSRFSGFIPEYKPSVTEKSPTQGGGLLGAGLTALGALKGW